jgi:Centriolar protein SAS N-terminal
MSRELFAGELPVTVLPAGGIARTRGNGPPSTLTAALTLSPSHVLCFSLADLRDRLFHYAREISAQEYAAVQSASLLRVDFAAFPAQFADLLARVRAEDAFVAFLELPEDGAGHGDAAGAPPNFCVAERKNLGYAPQVAFSLAVSSDLVVRREIAARTKLAEGAAAAAEERAAAAEARAAAAETAARALEGRNTALQETLDAVTAAHAPCDRQREAACRDAERSAAQLEEQERELRTLRARAEEDRELCARLDATATDLEAASAARDALTQDLGVSRANEAEAVHKLTTAIAELHKGNRLLAVLRRELRVERRNGAVAEAVREQQEKAVEAGEARVSELQRDLRRTKDRLEMVELERDGMAARLASARKTIENDKVLIDKDRKSIAYLNRELNKAAMALDARRGGLLARSPSEYDTTTTSTLNDSRPSSDSPEGPQPRPRSGDGRGALGQPWPAHQQAAS